MTPEEEAKIAEAKERFSAQFYATKWLRRDVSELEQRLAAGDALLTAKRVELVEAEARTAELDIAVDRATAEALIGDTSNMQEALEALLYFGHSPENTDSGGPSGGGR
jgi:hypothetical protein